MPNPDRLSDDVSLAVASELRAETARRQLRQKQVAEALGLAQSSISDRWRGSVPLTVDQFVAWCRLLGLDPGDVLTRAMSAASVTPLTQDDVDRAADDGYQDGEDEGTHDDA